MNDFMYKNIIAVDISKDKLDVRFGYKGKLLHFDNHKKGIHALIKVLPAKSDCLVVMEATGGFEKALSLLLHQSEYKQSIINPRRIRDFAKAAGILAKTDALDTNVIALFGERIQPQPSIISDVKQDGLSELNRRRNQLIGMIKKEKVRRHQTTHLMIKNSIEKSMSFLTDELKSIEELLVAGVKKSDSREHVRKLMKTTPGIGEVTTITLVVDAPEIGKLSSGQIAALIGVAPFNHDSGKHKGKRSIYGGRAHVREALYMPTMTAIRFNPVIKAFYARLINKGKPHKVALIACMRKLLVILNAMVKNDSAWNPKHCA